MNESCRTISQDTYTYGVALVSLFCRALLQKRPINLSILLTKTTPHQSCRTIPCVVSCHTHTNESCLTDRLLDANTHVSHEPRLRASWRQWLANARQIGSVIWGLQIYLFFFFTRSADIYIYFFSVWGLQIYIFFSNEVCKYTYEVCRFSFFFSYKVCRYIHFFSYEVCRFTYTCPDVTHFFLMRSADIYMYIFFRMRSADLRIFCRMRSADIHTDTQMSLSKF